MTEQDQAERLIKMKDCIFGWVQILPDELRDNGDHTFTFVNRAIHFGHDGRITKRTERDGISMYIPPKANFDPRITGIRVIKKLFGKP